MILEKVKYDFQEKFYKLHFQRKIIESLRGLQNTEKYFVFLLSSYIDPYIISLSMNREFL